MLSGGENGWPGVYSITVGPDGALWFIETTSLSNSSVGRITTRGQVSLFPVNARIGGGSTIVAGPDGNLWFTDSWNGVYRMTPSGTVTAFSVPAPANGPQLQTSGITPGPDGATWFTMEVGNAVGRITTDGKITTFALPSTRQEVQCGRLCPTQIISGPDGALWFAENQLGGAVGRMTTDGSYTQFAIPATAGAPGSPQPSSLAVGSDGAIWVSDMRGAKLWRLTTSGQATSISLPDSLQGATPYAVGVGPDQAIWFTTNKTFPGATAGGDRIARVSTGGLEFYVGGSGSAFVVGPDHAMWFAAYDRILCLTPPSAT